MIITKVRIQNFRALKDVTFNMSSFSCIIGENNSGKSSLMQAISLFLKPVKLNETDYYDKNNPVIISATMAVSEDDFKAITDEEHRDGRFGPELLMVCPSLKEKTLKSHRETLGAGQRGQMSGGEGLPLSGSFRRVCCRWFGRRRFFSVKAFFSSFHLGFHVAIRTTGFSV